MIVIYGEPVGKGRPRFKRIGNFVQTYTPKETVNYETLIKNEYFLQSGKTFEDNIPLWLKVYAYYKIPKSFSKKKVNQCVDNILKPCVKPDCDNILKIVMDSLNKVAYADDKQICRVSFSKRYSMNPRIEIEVKEIEE